MTTGAVVDAVQVRKLVESQINSKGAVSNDHGVDLRRALVPPQKIFVIAQDVRDGKFQDEVIQVWLVLVEGSEDGTGYGIVLSEDGESFGLAILGFPGDAHLALVGWYGDFMTTFRDM